MSSSRQSRPTRTRSSTANNSNSLSNNSDTDRSNREYVLPTSMVRLLRIYMRPPETLPKILRQADFDYQHYILWAKRDLVPMFVLTDSMLETRGLLLSWLSLRREITRAMGFISKSNTVLENEFTLLEEVLERFSRSRVGRRFAFQNGAVLLVFTKHVLPQMSFAANLDSLLPKLQRSERLDDLIHIHQHFKTSLRTIDNARDRAQIPIPSQGPANESRRYRVRPSPRRHPWLNKVTNLPLSRGERAKARNVVTGGPMDKGVPLACGHVISKDTLVQLTKRVGGKRVCPYCRTPITRKHLLDVAAMDPQERVRAMEQAETNKTVTNATAKPTRTSR